MGNNQSIPICKTKKDLCGSMCHTLSHTYWIFSLAYFSFLWEFSRTICHPRIKMIIRRRELNPWLLIARFISLIRFSCPWYLIPMNCVTIEISQPAPLHRLRIDISPLARMARWFAIGQGPKTGSGFVHVKLWKISTVDIKCSWNLKEYKMLQASFWDTL